MRWKVAIGGGEQGKKGKEREETHEKGSQEAKAENRSSMGDTRNNQSNGESGGGRTSGGSQSNQGGQGGQMNGTQYRGMTHAAYYSPQANYPYPGHSGGPHAMNGRGMEYYANNMMGDMMPAGSYQYMPQNRQMGFILTDPEEDDYFMETEARRRRSKRTGRFIRGEGGNEMESRYKSRDDDEGQEERKGSYHKSGREDDGELERLHKKIKKLEQRLEEGEEAQEHVRHLKKEVKRLKEALEEMKEDQGGDGGADREKRDKKKKERAKSEDEDDEDDLVAGLRELLQEGVNGKEFLKHLPRIFCEAFEVIANPPKTWPSYLEKGDYSGIYAMEAKELMRAIEQYKAGQKGVDDVMREIKHTGAALIQLYAHLIHQLDKKN